MHLIISSTRGNNLKLAKALEGIALKLKMKGELICLEDFELPIYTPTAEKEGIPAQAIELTEVFTRARSLIICAPEYNGSLPPILNNAIAWISRSGNEDWRASFNGKPAVVVTHSGGGGLKVTQAMRSQLEHLGAVVIPRPIITNFQKEINLESAEVILTQLKTLTHALKGGIQ